MASSILDDTSKIAQIDKSNMLSYCVDSAKHYREAEKTVQKVALEYPKPENITVSGMGGSAIGGELLKDWAREKAQTPIEVSRDYTLPAYANQKTLTIIVSYSGETEETLSAFLDAVKRKCMIFCVSSGGALLEYAEKLGVPYVRVPAGMPPRAALPYLFVPLLVAMEKVGIVSGVSDELSEATKLLERIGKENAPERPVKGNTAKALASEINGTVPVVYGFGVFRGVAQRFKTQFNENSKMPSKWEYFSELNHNEIVGWEKASELVRCFSTVFIRDKAEPPEIRTRIEATRKLMPPDSKTFEVWSQGKSMLAKMLSTILVGDFTSVYLAILRNVDPTPVETISLLKQKMKQSGTKEKIIRELSKIAVQ
ncbi:bifunctional phosphoglucose/phosphomannose isomerase [Candidatus Bathyarchaeota archaeon A05DMB-2]|jgi:glucose/mannose-6-phosphate isomerase|nr:bifunctional phosphoglucose/phosphomannose isomerase [Candidatus Bathyarchaeota archaeon A05DMB-2]